MRALQFYGAPYYSKIKKGPMPSPCLEFYGLGMGPLNRLFYGRIVVMDKLVLLLGLELLL
jgi:hypothetical protein